MTGINYHLNAGAGSFQIPALSARGLARANRSHMIAELAYGSYTAQIHSQPAPEDGIPRQQ